jgi:hypothetical protein
MRPVSYGRIDMTIVLIEKYCSHCHICNYDSKTGIYNENCSAPGREGLKCDVNGTELKYDEQNNIVP